LANYLIGGAGADSLNGGAGNDTFIGGAASDTFVFGTGSGTDTVCDFTPGSDLIDVSAYHFADFDSLMAATTDVGSGVFITLDPDNLMALTGVLKAQLTVVDFLL
ncbi:M10 family metallopeptidase C-terminal domain-containing protein, partial [Reyranella soli]|uniref:M10 family metallopeptidase C-terminal domain-containing protein n=1 Tax=Reyranella soli TaxID=1230389 RepID=UPI0015828453